MIAARGARRRDRCFDVTENEHRDHILKISRVPAALSATPRRTRRAGSPETIARQHAAMSACWRSRCSCCATAACWSTKSRRGCTIPATGRSTARRCRNSSSTSARSPAGRWPADPPRPGRDGQPDRQRGRGLPRAGSRFPAPRSISTARPPCARAARWGTSRGCFPIERRGRKQADWRGTGSEPASPCGLSHSVLLMHPPSGAGVTARGRFFHLRTRSSSTA